MDRSELRRHQAAPPSGALQGGPDDGVTVFRGVPYALPPCGALRFMPPEPMPAWSGLRDATRDGPIPLQPPSRLAVVMGEADRPQSEDCLTLTLWTPAADGGQRPVLVWLHGGAYSSGAGSLPWYSGASLARHGDIVVVCVNFRLGALGYLYLPGTSPGNLGLLDQLLALRWVADNIHAFGGDPRRVTLAGQSSGASSVAALLTSPKAHQLCRRAILQSAPLGRPDRDPALAAEQGERYRGIVAELGGGTDLRTTAAQTLVAAQGPYARTLAALPGATELPFMPVADGDTVVSTRLPADPAVSGCREILIGSTREEMAAFHAADPQTARITEEQARGVFAALGGPDAERLLQASRRRRVARRPLDWLGDLLTDRLFRLPALEYARGFSAAGGQAFVYQFDWQSPAGVQACHCLELPFIFRQWQAWHEAPMLRGLDSEQFDALARVVQTAWLRFIRTGDPNHDLLPEWPPLRDGRCPVMHLDGVLRCLEAEPAA